MHIAFYLLPGSTFNGMLLKSETFPSPDKHKLNSFEQASQQNDPAVNNI